MCSCFQGGFERGDQRRDALDVEVQKRVLVFERPALLPDDELSIGVQVAGRPRLLMYDRGTIAPDKFIAADALIWRLQEKRRFIYALVVPPIADTFESPVAACQRRRALCVKGHQRCPKAFRGWSRSPSGGRRS